MNGGDPHPPPQNWNHPLPEPGLGDNVNGGDGLDELVGEELNLDAN